MKNHATMIPQWIGVKKDWHLESNDPLEHLIELPPQVQKTHVYAIGATGAGKTNLLHHMQAQDIERSHSIVAFDSRGDLVDAVLELAAGRVDPSLVTLIDLREKQNPHGFDPLYGPGEPYFRALGVLDAVANESDSWGIQLAESLRFALMLFAEVGEPITRLDQLFYDASFRLQCLAKAEASPVTGFWERFNALSIEKQHALAMPVLNKLSILTSTPALRKVLGHPNPIDLGKQLNTAGSITLISLAVDELHGAAKMMGNMILASVTREIFARVQIPEHQRNPVRIYVDEFENFVLKEFDSLLAEGRRFAASLVLAHQTLAQLTPRFRSMILGNVGVKFAFRAGREDSQTLCKDLTGDPKLYDLNNLATGEALMWVRGQGEVLIEVNEPLLHSTGWLSPEGREFRQAILDTRSHVEVCDFDDDDDPFDEPQLVNIHLPTEPKYLLASGTKHQPLEDWLCS